MIDQFTDPAAELSGELTSGEKLLWTGRPRQGIFFRGTDVLLIPFSLLWGGFAIFWEVGVLTATRSHPTSDPLGVVFPLFGIPFVAIGLYFIFGRFFADAAQRKRTIYAITNQRVIIRSGVFSRTTKSLNLRTLSDVTLSEKRDSTGTITLGPTIGWYSWFQGTSWPGMGKYQPPMFDSITDAKNVYDLLRKAQANI
jgi:Bacterial PH domain